MKIIGFKGVPEFSKPHVMIATKINAAANDPRTLHTIMQATP